MTIGYQTGYATTGDVPSPLLRWSAVLGGLVLGLALLLLLSALWLASAYGSEMKDIRDNLEWYIGISAIVSLFVAAILTGYLSGVGGAGTGMLHGFTLWGLLIVVAITVGIPSVMDVFGLRIFADQAVDGRLLETGNGGGLWAAFWTIVGGFVAAGVGGMIGGLATRRRAVVSTIPASRVVVPESTTADDGVVKTTTLRS